MDIFRVRVALPVTVLVVIAASSTASAADAADAGELARFSLTPFAGYTFGGKFKDEDASMSVDVDDAAHFGLAFNIRESANTQWEIFYARQSTEADTSGIGAAQPVTDIDIQYLQFGGTYVADGGIARPFLAVTLGATRFEPDPLTFDSENFLSFGAGAGWYLRASERLHLRLEGRLLGTLLRADSDLFCETGPGENVCALEADGDFFWQFQASVGLIFRF